VIVIGVFCGSSPDPLAHYVDAAQTLARELVARGCRIVYGGGRMGLMGVVAETALAAGGYVIGVTPGKLLKHEVMHHGLSELHQVSTLHERKALMTQLADAFVILPGGYGTLDELFEILVLQQLRVHDKRYALLNVNGYFDGLVAFLDRAVADGLLHRRNRELLRVENDIPSLLRQVGV
jgi:uncharacterized protein (TIGR00730 family)